MIRETEVFWITSVTPEPHPTTPTTSYGYSVCFPQCFPLTRRGSSADGATLCHCSTHWCEPISGPRCQTHSSGDGRMSPYGGRSRLYHHDSIRFRIRSHNNKYDNHVMYHSASINTCALQLLSLNFTTAIWYTDNR